MRDLVLLLFLFLGRWDPKRVSVFDIFRLDLMNMEIMCEVGIYTGFSLDLVQTVRQSLVKFIFFSENQKKLTMWIINPGTIYRGPFWTPEHLNA